MMKAATLALLCVAFVLTALSAGAEETVPGPDPVLLDVFNHASGYGTFPTSPCRVARKPPPKHYGHVTILKLYEPGTGGPGGSVGGEAHTFSHQAGALFRIDLFNPDDPSEPHRIIDIPIDGIIETGPRNPGDAVQDFDTEMVQLQGSIFGDPDFAELTVRVGRNFGLPSPGHTTLTRLGLPGSDFAVDSFFDIFYEIDFQGAPGSVYEGVSGTETGTVRFGLGHELAPVIPEPGAAALMLLGLGGLARRRRK